MRIIFVILTIILLSLAAPIAENAEESAYEEHKAECVNFYLNSLKDKKTPNVSDALSANAEIEDFVGKNFPDLALQWAKIRTEYRKNAELLYEIGQHYADLVAMASLPIPNDESLPIQSRNYVKYVQKLQSRNARLVEAHRTIIPVAERFYAEAQVRSLESDEEVRTEMSDVLEHTKAVLEEMDKEL